MIIDSHCHIYPDKIAEKTISTLMKSAPDVKVFTKGTINALLESMKNYFLPTSPMLEERREITALDLAISALSKQSASCEQADHIAEPDKMVKLKKRKDGDTQ